MVDCSLHSNVLTFYVNGKKICGSNIDPEWNLLYYLRHKLRLTGAKLGCGEGGCGSCTVMVSSLDRSTGLVNHYTVNACLASVVSLHGLSVTTVEGIGSVRTKIHPVQERISKAHGSQCGFCTPGFVMAMYTLLRNNPKPSLSEIEDHIKGNLCRCTGYRPILEGFSSFSNDVFNPGCGKKDCCQRRAGHAETSQDESSNEKMSFFDKDDFSIYDPTQDIIFPPELKLNGNYDSEELVIIGRRIKWIRPVTLERLLELKTLYPEAMIVVGNTVIGSDMKFKNSIPSILISPSRVENLKNFFVCKSGAIIGAALSLSEVETKLKKVVSDYPENKTRSIRSLLEMLRWFGSKQIRNVACLGGNIMTCSPISDLNPVLVAMGAQLKFKSLNGERKVTMTDKFFTGYRTNNSSPTEVLIDVFLPFSKEKEFIYSFKQSRRRDDDIAIVNAGFRVEFSSENTVQNLILAFGGMQEKTIEAKNTMKELEGIEWNEKLLEKGLSLLLKDLPLDPSSPGGMAQYRQTLALSFFFKFFMNVKNDLSEFDGESNPQPAQPAFPSYNRPISQGNQFYCMGDNEPVGRPLVHSSAVKQSSGEAVFVDDLPRFENELWAALVLSDKASATILHIDSEAALQMDGVIGFYSAKDVPGSNKTGVVVEDEEVFASEEVHYAGEVIGVVVAEDQLVAKEAAKRVKITYQEKKPVLTIEDALKRNMVWSPQIVRSGDVIEGFKTSDHILEGSIHIGGQEHFYMETQSCIVIPTEEGEFEVISATQNPAETQRNVATALGIPLNSVVCKTKRLGGGFGGKEIKAGRVASYAAVAAAKTHRPIRIVLDRYEDMKTTGGRHPVSATWKVGFKNNGTVEALKIEMLANAGYSLDISNAMATKAILHADNVYRIANTFVSCSCCQTNLASNTACRGTGAPQSMLIMEDIITNVATYLKMMPHQVREMNMHKTPNPQTHYGQKLENCTVKQCWDEVLSVSNFEARRKEVEAFNEKHAYVKRGICAIPSKMAISFGLRTLEQAGAMVHIYKDGSVLLTHGGVEMGQGLHTKMIQVAAKVLDIPVENIKITETSTDKIPNTSPTAASCSSDLNGMAVKAACEELVARLMPYKTGNPNGSWKEHVEAAYNDRVSLLGTGFYKTPGLLDFDFENQEGNPYNYFTYGAAVSEVEIDTLTGNHTVLQTDIVMDVGQSLNPAIDVGQIEGAFTFGYGLYTLEELEYTPDGSLLTLGPGSYKLPALQDMPCKMNVSLLRASSNLRAIFSSRGVGEPPLFLASSVFFAIKDAISNAKAVAVDQRVNFQLDSPATSERIRQACDDRISKMVQHSSKSTSGDRPWCIRV